MRDRQKIHGSKEERLQVAIITLLELQWKYDVVLRSLLVVFEQHLLKDWKGISCREGEWK